MSQKLTTEQVNAVILSKGYQIDPDFNWVNSGTPVSYICPKHGKMQQTYHNMLRTECVKCSHETKSRIHLSKSTVSEKLATLLKERNLELLEKDEPLKSTSRIKVRCPVDGHEWDTHYNRLSFNKKGCSVCAGNKTLTTEQVNQVVVGKGYRIDPDFVWKNSAQPVSYICPKHGKQEQLFSNLKRSACYPCSVEQNTETRIKNSTVNLRLMELLDKRGFELLDPPASILTDTLIRVKCKKDGHVWETTYNRLEGYRHGCKVCAGTKPLSFWELKAKLEDNGFTVLDSEPAFFNEHTSFKILCPQKHETTTSGNKINSGYGCKYCARVAIDTKEVSRRLNEIGFTLKVPYQGMNNLHLFTCKKGHKFQKTFSAVWYGRVKCPQCDPPYTSKGEESLASWLKEIFHENEIERSDRTVLNGHEIDILIRSKNIGIEFNGLYYHNEIALMNAGKTQAEAKAFHQSKMVRALQKNIQLITVWEYEWVERKLAVKTRLKALLGLNNIRIGGRQVEIRLVTDKKIVYDFLNTYHVQGAAKFKYAFGLFFKNELISIMTFGSHHRQNVDKDSLVLNRYCVKYDHTVSGGAQRLFRHALKELNTPRIISYSDNRWSQGKIYETLGFERTHVLGPDYFYANPTKRSSKQSLKKTKIEKTLGKTERDLRLEQGLFRVWDCGKMTWEYPPKKK